MKRLLLLGLLLTVQFNLPDTVRVASHGTRYHLAGCPALHGLPGELVTRSSADSAGYKPCHRCLLKTARKPSRLASLSRVR